MKKLVSIVLALTMALLCFGVAFAAAPDTDVTVTVNGVKSGNTLALYKIADAAIDTNNTIKYTMASGLPTEYDNIDKIAAASDVDAMARAFGYSFGGTAPTYSFLAGTGDVATGAVAPGYYYAIVTGTADTGVVYKAMLINAVPVVDAENNGFKAHDTIEITAKKEPVTILKQEETSPTDDTKVKTTDGYSIGDYINFTITTKIPNYPSNSKNATVIITDTPTGLVDDITSNFEVKVDGAAITTANYDLERKDGSDTTGFKVTLKDKAFILANAGKSLVITYRAQLVGPAHHTTNTATLTYNPNPYEDTTVSPPDTDEQKTYGFVFNKTNSNHVALAGATFALYKADGTTAVTDASGTALTFTTTVSNEKAYVYWEGLAAGTYKVKETNAPAGYVPAADFEVTLSSSVCTGDNPATDATEDYYLVITDDVVNNEGATLPETGGIGTTIFYILGGLLVVGAAVILVARRKAQD